MLKAELLEIIANGENSGVEFKRDEIRPEQLAKEIVAFANLQGGRILLGVEDDGQITGLQRLDAQEWVLNVFRDKVHLGYVDAQGMGVRTKVIPLMKRHNQTEPVFEATEDYLKTVLPRKKP